MESSKENIILGGAEAESSLFAQAGWIVSFAGLTALGAQIEIPNYPVPFTLQTFFVLLSGAFLGGRNGFYAQAVYLAAGAIGLPVFSSGAFGIAKLFGPTGGYLLSFPLAAFIAGYGVHLRRGFAWTLASLFVSLIVLFTSGFLYLNFIFIHDLKQAFVSGFLIFSWWDVLKLTAAAAIYNQFSKKYKKLPS